jgi:hypothetical protein
VAHRQRRHDLDAPAVLGGNDNSPTGFAFDPVVAVGGHGLVSLLRS